MANYRKRQLIVRLAALALLEKVNTRCIYQKLLEMRCIIIFIFIYSFCVGRARGERELQSRQSEMLRDI
jgi:hypothetical protein